MKTMMAVVLLVGGVVACKGKEMPPGEQQHPESGNAGPASLWRRLAEAADGFRDGKDKWVVLDRKFPHKVLDVFDTEAAADSARTQAIASTGVSYEKFGPFNTINDPPYEGDTDPVDSVVVYRKSGREAYSGTKYDAVIWGLPAFDKFIAPYLTYVSGVKYAAEQREDYRQGKSTLVHSTEVAHYRSSF
jgi:hypothetical protein